MDRSAGPRAQAVRASSVRSSLRGKERLLPLRPPAVTGEASVGVDDAVTGHREGDRVRRTGPGDGAGGRRMADGARHLGVAGGASGGDGPERLPDLALEARRLDVEGEVLGARALTEGRCRGAESRVRRRRGALELGPRELGAEEGLERLRGVTERHPAQSPLGPGEEQGPEGRVEHRPDDVLPGAALSVLGGTHPHLPPCCCVGPPRRAIARLEPGLGHRLAGAQLRLPALEPCGGDELLGREPGVLLERLLEVRRADARGPRERVEAGRSFEVGDEERLHLVDHRLGGTLGELGPAALARSVPLALGGGGVRKEAHVLPERAARRAGGAAVDAGGVDGHDELAVRARIAPDEGLPAAVLGVVVHHRQRMQVHSSPRTSLMALGVPPPRGPGVPAPALDVRTSGTSAAGRRGAHRDEAVTRCLAPRNPENEVSDTSKTEEFRAVAR